MARRRECFIGQTFNRLTIMEDGCANDKVSCSCQCGGKKRIRRRHVTSGRVKSCGCLQSETAGKIGKITKHGLSYHPLYNCYINLINRCYNPNHHAYEHYGAKGVTVCERWRETNGVGFQHFIDDKFDTWFEGAHLDKDKFAKPNELKCYSPETCCWISGEENGFIRHHPYLYPISRLSTFDPFISYKLATT